MLPISCQKKLLVVEHEMEAEASPPIRASPNCSRLRCEWSVRVYDMLGIASMEPDKRGWLRHGGWPEKIFPLRRDFDGGQQFAASLEPTRCPGRRRWCP